MSTETDRGRRARSSSGCPSRRSWSRASCSRTASPRTKDIEIGMMAGAGILPGPFTRADEQGLDEVLAALERAEAEWGENFAPPKILRRLVGQGRLGQEVGPGVLPLPAAGRGPVARDDRARDPRRHRHLLAQPAACQPAVARGDQASWPSSGRRSTASCACSCSRRRTSSRSRRARTSRSSRRWTPPRRARQLLRRGARVHDAAWRSRPPSRSRR